MASTNGDTWTKWVTGMSALVLVGWMGFISVTQIRMDRNLVELKIEVGWIKDEANNVINHRIQVDATQDRRIAAMEEEVHKCRERLIRAEVYADKHGGKQGM